MSEGPCARRRPLRQRFSTGDGDIGREGSEQDENAQGENREAGRRVRARPDAPAAFDGDEPPPEKPVTVQPEAAAQPAEQVRIPRSKWTYLYNHVLACIKQAENGELEAAQRIESSAQTFMGVPQHDIIKWHIKEELQKCVSRYQHVQLHANPSRTLWLPIKTNSRMFVTPRNYSIPQILRTANPCSTLTLPAGTLSRTKRRCTQRSS